MTKPDYKITCGILNQILTIRNLSEKQLLALYNKVKSLVKDTKPSTKNVLPFVKMIVLAVLTKEEIANLNKLLEGLNKTDENQVQLITQVFIAIYHSIIDVYPTLGLDVICADLNGFLDEALKNDDPSVDKTFDEILSPKKKEKKKGVKATKSLSTLDGIDALHKHLTANVIGQEEAIRVICDALKLKAVGFSKTVNLFFLGKTGTGKSYISRLIGEKYSNNFWLLNCSEFSNGHEINRLLGAPPGYVGYTGTSLLKDKADKSNKWVIVFDEIEKAHDKFFNFLLALMETGKCTDNLGIEIDLSDSIFVFTSNCGLKELKTTSVNFKSNFNHTSNVEELKKSMEHQFSPEFRNRIDEIVFFKDLTREDTLKIAELRLKEYPLKRTQELIEYVSLNGFSEDFGAREVNRFIKRNIALPLANSILAEKKPNIGKIYEAKIVDGKVEILS
jgi:ATP-dependent Clp protease ATP-binding subunit ClpA